MLSGHFATQSPGRVGPKLAIILYTPYTPLDHMQQLSLGRNGVSSVVQFFTCVFLPEVKVVG
jgi:hypothetical protein